MNTGNVSKLNFLQCDLVGINDANDAIDANEGLSVSLGCDSESYSFICFVFNLLRIYYCSR